VKIGAKIVRRARYAVFQMAEVAAPKELFEEILRLLRRAGTVGRGITAPQEGCV